MGIGVMVAGGTRKPKIEDVVTGLLAGTVSLSEACKCDNCMMALLETRRRCLDTPGRTALLKQTEARLGELWKVVFLEEAGSRAIDTTDAYDELLARLLEARKTAQELKDSKKGDTGLVHRIAHSNLSGALCDIGVYYAENEKN